MTKYIKTSVTEFEQFDGSVELLDKYNIKSYSANKDSILKKVPAKNQAFHMPTLEGVLQIHIGDWIATGIDGEHWAVANEIFKIIYQQLPAVPQAIADWIEWNQSNLNALATALDESLMPAAVKEWFKSYQTIFEWQDLQDRFARAWLDGYEVETKS